jgi:PHD/YefM family antitoxin component YafN of YafNO toxin-antitoxin module
MSVKYHLTQKALASTLKRKTAKVIPHLAGHGEPVLITHQSRSNAYLVDGQTYEKLGTKIAVLEMIARGEQAIVEGRVKSHKAARKRMSKWLH